MQKREIEQIAEAILVRVRTRMFGVDEVTRLIMVAFYTGGHVLLEGNPGLGKTDLVKTLGQILGVPYGRIQFTPDLMPADITGTYAPDFENQQLQKLVFQKGPVFTSLLLADEINRATPKTQSAMLEAMAEKQVTVLGKKYALDLPFMVLATQNPIDHEGTFNLPEAQADRFMFKINVPIPGNETMRLILSKTAGTLSSAINRQEPTPEKLKVFKEPGVSQSVYQRLKNDIMQFGASSSVETHILNMFLASNDKYEQMQGIDESQRKKARQLVEQLMVYGLGPRAAMNLMLGAKAWSAMFIPGAEGAEGPALARVMVPVLRHRLKLKFDWQETFLAMDKSIRKKGKPEDKQDGYETGTAHQDALLAQLILAFCMAAAPGGNEYPRIFQQEFTKALNENN